MARRGNPGVWGTAGVRPKPKPKPKPPRVGGLSPAPFDPYRDAQKSAAQIIAEMLSSVERDKQTAKAAADREAALELTKAQALAQGLQQLGIPQNIQNIFNTAGQTQAGLAQGFSGNIRTQANEQAAEQIRQLSGTGQEGAVRNQGDNMGNVVYGVGGFIPGNELATLGAAYGGQAALQPGFATQFGQLAEAARRQKWVTDELPGFTDQRLDVLGKKPALFQEMLSANRSYASDLFNQNMTVRKQKLDEFTTYLNAKLATGEFSLKQAEQELDKWKAANPEPTNLQARTLANGQIQWFDPLTGQPVGAPTGPVKAKTSATSSRAKIEAKREAEFAKISGVPSEAKTYIGVGDSGTVRKAKRTRAQTVRYLVRLYRQRLARYGVKDKRIVKAVNEMVAAMPADWFVGGGTTATTDGNPFG